MFQVPGPISARLLAEHGDRAEDCDAWKYVRDEEATDAIADYGFRLGRRWAQISPASPDGALSVSASPAPDRPGSDLAATAAA